MAGLSALAKWADDLSSDGWYRATFDVDRYQGSWSVALFFDRHKDHPLGCVCVSDANLKKAIQSALDEFPEQIGHCDECGNEWPNNALVTEDGSTECPECRGAVSVVAVPIDETAKEDDIPW